MMNITKVEERIFRVGTDITVRAEDYFAIRAAMTLTFKTGLTETGYRSKCLLLRDLMCLEKTGCRLS